MYMTENTTNINLPNRKAEGKLCLIRSGATIYYWLNIMVFVKAQHLKKGKPMQNDKVHCGLFGTMNSPKNKASFQDARSS